jgi:ABC-type oligopeptide transport system substrate-binding subunit
MCLAYDVDAHIRNLYAGRGVRARTFVPASFAEAALAPSPYARLDRAAAKAKLAEAVKELAAKGLLRDGKIPPIRLSLAGAGDYQKHLGAFVREQFGRLGLDIKLEFMHWPALQRQVHTGNVQLFTMGWHADYPDAENFLQLYYGRNIKAGTNSTRYNNAAFDELFAEAVKLTPGKRRTDLYVRMLKMLNEDCPSLLLSEELRLTLRWNWLKNYKPHPVGYGYDRFLRIDRAARRRGGPSPKSK